MYNFLFLNSSLYRVMNDQNYTMQDYIEDERDMQNILINGQIWVNIVYFAKTRYTRRYMAMDEKEL